MKINISIIFLLVISIASFSQQKTTSPTLTKQDYLKKSKSQKTAGWILLGGGAALLTYAATGDISLDGLSTIVVLGGVATLASIPFLISSAKNKKKASAATVLFKMETAPQLRKYGFTNRSVPSLSLKISL